MSVCPECDDRGFIVVDKSPTHEDYLPCPECTGTVWGCRGGVDRPHQPISFRAKSRLDCPLCKEMRQWVP